MLGPGSLLCLSRDAFRPCVLCRKQRSPATGRFLNLRPVFLKELLCPLLRGFGGLSRTSCYVKAQEGLPAGSWLRRAVLIFSCGMKEWASPLQCSHMPHWLMASGKAQEDSQGRRHFADLAWAGSSLSRMWCSGKPVQVFFMLCLCHFLGETRT